MTLKQVSDFHPADQSLQPTFCHIIAAPLFFLGHCHQTTRKSRWLWLQKNENVEAMPWNWQQAHLLQWSKEPDKNIDWINAIKITVVAKRNCKLTWTEHHWVTSTMLTKQLNENASQTCCALFRCPLALCSQRCTFPVVSDPTHGVCTVRQWLKHDAMWNCEFNVLQLFAVVCSWKTLIHPQLWMRRAGAASGCILKLMWAEMHAGRVKTFENLLRGNLFSLRDSSLSSSSVRVTREAQKGRVKGGQRATGCCFDWRCRKSEHVVSAVVASFCVRQACVCSSRTASTTTSTAKSKTSMAN